MVASGAFVCPECGKPLIPLEAARSLSPRALAIGAAAAALLLVVAFVALQVWRVGAGSPGGVPAAASGAAAPEPSAAPSAAPAGTPAAAPADVPVVRAEPVAPPSAEARPNLDLAHSANRDARVEVLKRIDLMPSVSADNKDRLYMAVERARQMGKVVSVPFRSGQSSLAAAEIESLRAALASESLKRLVDDPTVVFVVLGFADTKGDEKKNLAISEARAQSVVGTLRDRCGVANVLHAVGMGGSTLFDPSGNEKNRVAEIWAVLP